MSHYAIPPASAVACAMCTSFALVTAKFVVISSPIRFIPDELYRDILCVEFKVPDSIEVRAFLEERAAAITASGGTVDMSEATVARMTGALLGLTLDEAGFAIQRALADGNRLGVGSLPRLVRGEAPVDESHWNHRIHRRRR